MNIEEYNRLFHKYLEGKCSPDEIERLFNYDDKFRFVLGETEDEFVKERIRKSIYNKIAEKKTFSLKSYIYYAAAITVFLLSVIAYKFIGNNKSQANQAVVLNDTRKDKNILPLVRYNNSAEVMLTFGDGSSVSLNEAKEGLLKRISGIDIKKAKGDGLTYQNIGNNLSFTSTINKLEIPKGKIFKLVLSDGTKVWLNASSTLVYPSRFVGLDRVVTLEGEAYFEVAKNKSMPFKVKTKDGEIKVLGTHFNVSAYNNDKEMKTTLIEGSVLVSNISTEKKMYPGQQAAIKSDSEDIEIKEVKTFDVLAWRDGYFIFNGNTIEEIMNQIARWYDVEVVYNLNGRTSSKIGGIYTKSKNLEELLQGLELTGLVKFKIEEQEAGIGRRVIVMN